VFEKNGKRKKLYVMDLQEEGKIMRIALIAHDGKKADMVAFVMKRLDFFNDPKVAIVATGTTGKHILHAGISKIQQVNSGPMGGDAEIGSMVARGEITAVIFFRDPLDKHPHEPDIQMLMRVCDVHCVPLATNYDAAHIFIKHFKDKTK
jgi:methylglyoxal synthase